MRWRWRRELGKWGALRAVSVLGEEVVIWRGTEGRPRLAGPVCPPWGAAFLGRVVDGCALRCAYHGWTYDEAGQCIAMPAHPSMKPPKPGSLAGLSLRGTLGFVWVSLGESAGDRVELGELTIPAFGRFLRGPYPSAAGAPRLIENFLDVAHLPIVHEGTLGDGRPAEILPYEVDLVDGRPAGSGARYPHLSAHRRRASLSRGAWSRRMGRWLTNMECWRRLRCICGSK